MSHHHHHHHPQSGQRLLITIILNILITVSQIIGGLISGSISLLSDALHNFSDVMALVIAWWAHKISCRENNRKKTYGYKRSQILAALFNGSVLIGLGIYLMVEAGHRFLNPQSVTSNIVILLAAMSIVLNALSVLIIKADSHHNLNMRAAYLHLLSDVMTSIAVLTGGILMKYYQIFWIDPLITVLIALYLIKTSYQLVSDSIAILMQSSPKTIDIREIEQLAGEYPELENIHHIHLWQLDDCELVMDAHLDFKEDISISASTMVKQKIELELKQKFAITHVTLQAEFNVKDNKNILCSH